MGYAISIVVPTYNDNTVIGTTIETLVDFLNRENIKGEIIIVNDGGREETVRAIKEKIEKYPEIKLIARKVNKGKGYTVREGLEQAQGDFIFYTDADLPYLTKPIKTIFEMLQRSEADLVLANRDFATDGDNKKPAWPRLITHRIYSLFVRLLLPLEFSDTLAGLKGMNKKLLSKIISKLTIDKWSFDVEILLVAKKAGFKIKEMPVSLKNVGKTNLNIKRDAPQMIKEVLQVWKKNRQGHYDF